jgi:hypothetical protein
MTLWEHLVWTSADGKIRAGLHGKNLTDKRYKTGGYLFPTLGNEHADRLLRRPAHRAGTSSTASDPPHRGNSRCAPATHPGAGMAPSTDIERQGRQRVQLHSISLRATTACALYARDYPAAAARRACP